MNVCGDVVNKELAALYEETKDVDIPYHARIFEYLVASKLGPLTVATGPGWWEFRDRFNRRVSVTAKELRFNSGKDAMIRLVKARLRLRAKKKKPIPSVKVVAK